MADPVEIKRGFGALYLLEMTNRAIEAIRAAGTSETSVETIEQNALAETLVNQGPALKY